MIGQTISHYRTLAKLGEGTSGTTLHGGVLSAGKAVPDSNNCQNLDPETLPNYPILIH